MSRNCRPQAAEAPLYATLCETEAGDADLQRIVALAARSCNAPISFFLQRVDEFHLLVKAAYGFVPGYRVPRLNSCSGRVMSSRSPVVIEDLDLMSATSALRERFGAKFYAGVPVTAPDGFVIGVLAVIDTVSRHNPPDQLVGILSDLADLIRDSLRLKAAVAERERSDQELRRQEEALRELADERTAILDGLPSYVAMIDSDGIIEFANKRWRLRSSRFLGRKKRVGESYLSRCVSHNKRSPEHALEVGNAIRRVLSGASPFEDLLYPYDVGSDTRWIRFFAVPMRRDGRIGAVIIHEDVTEIKRAEQKMLAAKQQIEAAHQTKSEFLANMSHELRTPLNAIIGFADLMLAKTMGAVSPSCYEGYIADIKASGEHLHSLIADILDLSKIEAGAFSPQLEAVDIPCLVAQAERLVLHRALKKNVSITITSVPPGVAAMVDRQSMLQAILNLMSNAVKFSPSGGEVSVGVEAFADGSVTVAVRDNGIGMDEEDIKLALEPFRQVENTMVKTAEGTGLGLPLAQRLVEAHGGRLEIESRRGVGTTVKVCLPPGSAVDRAAPHQALPLKDN